eukprot:UN32877
MSSNKQKHLSLSDEGGSRMVFRSKSTEVADAIGKLPSSSFKDNLQQLKKSCNHGYTQFLTETNNYYCDICQEPQNRKYTMYGCRECDYDLCQRCYDIMAFKVGDKVSVRHKECGVLERHIKQTNKWRVRLDNGGVVKCAENALAKMTKYDISDLLRIDDRLPY